MMVSRARFHWATRLWLPPGGFYGYTGFLKPVRSALPPGRDIPPRPAPDQVDWSRLPFLRLRINEAEGAG